MSSTAHCPNCGTSFPAGRLACPECGSDAETGWAQDALTGYSAADIPDTFTDEDYADVVADLQGGRDLPVVVNSDRRKRRQRQIVAAVVMLIAFVGGFIAFPTPRLVLFFFAVWGAGVLLLRGHVAWKRDRWLLAFVVALVLLTLLGYWAVTG